MSRIRFIQVIGALITAMMILTACAPSATPTPAAPAPTTAGATAAPTTAAATAAATAGQVVTLTVMHYYGEGTADQPQLLQASQEFTKEHPDIKINWIWAGSDATTKFQALINAGTPPDLYTDNDSNTAAFARLGIIQPVDQYLTTQNYTGTAVWKDTFYPGLIENGHIADAKLGDHYYGIPDNMHFGGIFYNKGLFDQKGYQIPQTWSDLTALCDKIQKDDGIPCFGADYVDGYNDLPLDMLWWRIVGAQTVYDTAMGKPGTTFNTPGFLEGAQLYQQLVTKYYPQGWMGNQWPAGQTEWANGGEAMIFMPSWLPSEVASTKATNFTMGMFQMPLVTGGYTGTPDLEVKFNGWVLPVGAKHPDQAMLFVKFLTDPTFQKARSDQYSLPSVLAAVDLPADLANMKTALTTDHIVRFAAGLDADGANWESKVYFPLVDELDHGTVTPQQFITQLDQQTKALYKQ